MSPIYVEKSAGYETVIITRAKKLRTGNIDKTIFCQIPLSSPNPSNLGNSQVKSSNYPGGCSLDLRPIAHMSSVLQGSQKMCKSQLLSSKKVWEQGDPELKKYGGT